MRHLFSILGLAAFWYVSNLAYERFIEWPAHVALHEGHLGIYMAAGWGGRIVSFPYLELLTLLNLSLHPVWFLLTSLIWGTTVYLLFRFIQILWRRRSLKSTPTA